MIIYNDINKLWFEFGVKHCTIELKRRDESFDPKPVVAVESRRFHTLLTAAEADVRTLLSYN